MAALGIAVLALLTSQRAFLAGKHGVMNAGAILASGGNGRDAFTIADGFLKSGGGGGGGGGLIHLLGTRITSLTGTADVRGGAGGTFADVPTGGAGTAKWNVAGAGGGGCAGSGGRGGAVDAIQTNPHPGHGDPGHDGIVIQTITDAPENLLAP